MENRKRKPIVAVVGRPNVGKSTLFNALAGSRISIVKDTPGITRDRIYADVTWLNYSFTLIDTGGIEPDSKDIILSQMREQAQIAIDTADVILFMVDVKQGLVDADAKVADMLRRSKKPIILVVNKVDSYEKMMLDVYEFYNLGIGEPMAISAANRQGIGEVLDEVVSHFPDDTVEDVEDERPRIAIVGKPNVGKSSLINKLLGENRLIVSDIAGTTRDAVDAEVTFNGKEYIFIDTAGRSHQNAEQLEKMKEMVGGLKRPEDYQVFLVLSATTKYRDLQKIADCYGKIAKFELIFTKLDETEAVGNLLNIKLYTDAPIAYVTCGQNVPDDMEMFNPQKTVKQILGGKE